MLYRCGENVAIKFTLLRNRDTVINLRGSRKEEEKEQEELGRGGRWEKRRGAGDRLEWKVSHRGKVRRKQGKQSGPSHREHGRYKLINWYKVTC